MHVDRSNTTARFSSAADTYDKAISVQPTVAETLFDLIPSDLAPRRILEIGCGTGLFTSYIAEFFNNVRLDALDASDRMLDQAKTKLAGLQSVHFHHERFHDYESDAQFDLIVSSSSLHWITPLEEAVGKVHGLLKPGGLFAAAIMLEGTLSELHATRLLVAPGKVPEAAMPSQTHLLAVLKDVGFHLTFTDAQSYTVKYSDVNTFLWALNRAGVTGGAFSRGSRPLTRGEIASLKDLYTREYGEDDGSIPATYHVGYVLAEHRSGE
ncbi:MAG: methyltransferase domain-containing protein [Verrucomicrobia bacterium]|nr:methyltransferase domain-containing protein [Verrucomicrobiota bacterium]